MPTCYTDGNGRYYMPTEPNAADPTLTDCEYTSINEGHSTKTVNAAFLSGLTVAPGLSDVGGNCQWINGLLVDTPPGLD